MQGSLIARNTLLNFGGQCLPLVVGVVCLPHIIVNLGPERFGLLSIAWVIFGTLSIFDLGMGRATTKYVAEALGKNDLLFVYRLVWTIVWSQLLLGLIGSGIGLLIVRVLGESLIQVSSPLLPEAIATFQLVLLGLPVVLLTNTIIGVLEAAHRFELTNAIRLPSASANFLLPLIGSLFGFNLSAIIILLIFGKIIALVLLTLFTLRTFPGLRNVRMDLAVLARVMTFGGWISVSNLVYPILTTLDRYILAALLPITAVGYYTAPAQAVAYLTIIPASMTTTLFPAYSTWDGMGRLERLQEMFSRSIKYTLLIVGPLCIIVLAFAGDLLTIWIGQEFAEQSTTALQILSLGVLVNSLAYSPSTLLQALGRPDVPAKFHLAELPIYTAIAWVCVARWGITGAAIAWSVRVTIDAILLFSGLFSVLKFAKTFFSTYLLKTSAVLVSMLGGSAYLLHLLTQELSIITQVLLFSLLVVIFGFLVWLRALDGKDRYLILSVGRELNVMRA